MYSNTRILDLYTKALLAARVRVVWIGATVFVCTLMFTMFLNTVSGRPVDQISLVQVGSIAGLSLAACWFALDSILKKIVKSFSTKQVLIRDINSSVSEKVRARTSELESASEELEQSLRIKTEFLAIMSHEIRTPMNGVLGMCQLLGETELTERQRRYVSIVNASGKSLLDLLNNVLDFSKIEAGKMQVENIPFDLESLVDECLSVFSLKALEKKVNLYGGLAKDVPRVCCGDPTRIRQILLNLLSNAVKFTFNGDVSLCVSLAKEKCADANTVSLRFDISDQGIGMTEAQQKTLFNAFSQTDISTARKYGGTGLGLVISKELLRLMDGEISVKSDLQNGTTFSIALELNSLAGTESEAYRKPEKSLGPISILVVESAGAAEQLKAQLEFWGATVFTAISAADARAFVESQQGKQINQIIAGAILPDGNGVELISELSNRLPNNHLQALVIMPISLESMTPPDGVFRLLERPVTSAELYHVVSAGAKTPTSRTELSNERHERQSFSDVRALIAEDNQVNQIVITGILKQFNISPTIVEDGADAVKTLSEQQGRFDLVLMDCEMPIMDGWEATERIRELELKNRVENPVKIVALSAHVIAEPKDRALASGMDQFVAKPVNIESVEQLLHEYFPRLNDHQELGPRQEH